MVKLQRKGWDIEHVAALDLLMEGVAEEESGEGEGEG